MAETPHSRRRFLKYAGAGVIATAGGIGYLTRDYWSSLLRGTPTSTPVTHQTQQAITSENPALTQPTTTATTTSETITTTEEMSEDEKMVRKLLEVDWVQAFNSEDVQKMLSLYNDNAIVQTWMGQYTFGKSRNWSLEGYYKWSAEVNARVYNYKIRMLKISGNKADVRSTYSYSGAGYDMTVVSQLELIKITETTKGNVTTKLPKPIWKIFYENTSF